jgi:hypothetical protein
LSHHPSASFITRWKSSGASERANYQLFLSELCELLQVEKRRPASDKRFFLAYSIIYRFYQLVKLTGQYFQYRSHSANQCFTLLTTNRKIILVPRMDIGFLQKLEQDNFFLRITWKGCAYFG